MKMEMNLTAPCAGLVKHITCQLGDAVEGGSVLIEIEPEV
jgi:biotin carboxyl carrier protein